MLQLESIKLPEQKSHLYLMADYLELSCLCSEDGAITLHDMVDAVYHSVDIEVERERVIEEGHMEDGFAGEYYDMQQIEADKWTRHLEYRQNVFNEFYPFGLNLRRQLAIKDNLTRKHHLYLFLLLCSSLSNLSKKCIYPLTGLFESLSINALERYMPGINADRFGKSLSGGEDYPPKLGDALVKLADNIKEQCCIISEDFNSKNTGDGGIDIVAWKPFPADPARNKFIAFGQCSCSPTQWIKKQYESHSSRIKKYINCSHASSNFMFIPVCFRDIHGDWYDPMKVDDCILIDRLRFCSLFSTGELPAVGFGMFSSFVELVAYINNGCSTVNA